MAKVVRSSIVDENLYSNKHSTYIVHFGTAAIRTTVTSLSGVVTSWIFGISDSTSGFGRLLVGLHIEWRPNESQYFNPAATLQICVDDRCLIFQLVHADLVPPVLKYFMASSHCLFVGVDIESDLEKLRSDHNFDFFPNCKDLRSLAAERYGVEDLRRSDLKRLVHDVLNVDIEKPANVETSRWDLECLSRAQIKHAAIDAYACFEIGRALRATHT
ncbi:hypothetical protein M569_11734 [Genlisea aurea]|uniref:3'-5' exonuclease domain-containing protein n=1 Tax=Genlisea aurea TaxID=192259 RepID=S8C874_9LAMI|nr:hypothetical protein M569_11734 [Genlisea aurea]